jgi:hypothetical protein
MLDRRLRLDKYPNYAAQIRENIIPRTSESFLGLYQLMDVTNVVCPNQHGQIYKKPTLATLFLHEDLVGRTLAFELDLQRWRRAEVNAGRGDPGRPSYEDVFPVSVIPTVPSPLSVF